MMEKGQVTFYILIGAIMLVAIGSAVYLAGKFSIKQGIEKDVSIKSFVEDCLQQTTIDAVKKLGAHGGYIDPRNSVASKKVFKFSAIPTESDGLFISPPDEEPVIYWWYLKSQNDCQNCFMSTENKPALNDEIAQIEEFVSKELPRCFNNFEPFLKQAYHVGTGNIAVKVLLTENGVKARLDMPTIVSRAGIETKQSVFEASVDVPLKKIYLLAEQIIDDQVRTQRIENLLLHQLSLYSDVDSSKLPPFSAVTHSDNVVFWNKQAVEENVKQALSIMMPLIRINRTKDAKEFKTKNTIEQGAYNALLYSIENSSARDFSVSFNYFDQLIYFRINPVSGNKLTPDIDRTSFPLNIMPPYQTNIYEFFYDISAPVLIRITSSDALKKDGYTFNIAIELNIRRNKDMLQYNLGEGTISPWDSSALKPSVKISSPEFVQCKEKSEKIFVCPVNSKEFNETVLCAENCYTGINTSEVPRINKTFFCNENQRVSGTVKINAVDEITRKPVRDASVTFICGKQLGCNLGTTNARGTARQKFPICYNGLLQISADGYRTFSRLLSTEADKREEITAELEQTKTLQLTARKARIKKGNDDARDCCVIETLNPFEKVIITFERVKETPWDAPLVTVAKYESQQKSTVELAPGAYRVDAVLRDELGYVLPKGCARGGGRLYPDEDRIVKPALLGGLKINNETGYLNISSAMLARSKSIEFTVAKVLTPNCIATTGCILPNCVGVNELGKVANYSIDFKDKLWPKILS